MHVRRFRSRFAATTLAAPLLPTFAGLTVAATPTLAVDTGQAQASIVSAVPSTATPNITDGVVYSITKVGNLVFAGGSFTSVQNQGSQTKLARTDILAFDAATGTVSTTFAPTLDGQV